MGAQYTRMAAMKQTALQATATRLPHTILREQTADRFFFNPIEQIMNTPYFTEDGDQLIVALCLIDSGYDADSTYDFCALNSEWALPVKGSNNPMLSHFKLSKINKQGKEIHRHQERERGIRIHKPILLSALAMRQSRRVHSRKICSGRRHDPVHGIR